MIIGSILELDIDENTQHLATSWYLSTTKDFSNIIAKSENDKTNLLNIVFPDIVLDPNVELYGRARVLTNNGWSGYNNMDIVSQDIDDGIFTLPSKISIPRLYTSKYPSKADRNPSDDIDFNNHPLTMFYISNDESFSVIGDSIHTASSWFIEDLDGNVVWRSIKNIKDLNIIKVDNIILERNKIYVAKHIMHSNTNDSSDCTSYRFKTIGLKNIALNSWMENTFNNLPADYQNGFTVVLPYDQGITDVYVQIYSNINDKLSLIYEVQLTNNDRNLVIGPNVIRQNGLYTVLFKTSSKDEYDVLTFSTYY